MAGDERSLKVKLLGDARSALKALDKTKGKLGKFGGAVGKLGGALKKMAKAGALAGAAIGVALVAALGASIKSFVSTGDAIHKMSLRTGVGTEALSELAHAAQLSGSSIEDVEKALKRQASTLEDAKDGLSTTVIAYDKLGLSIEELEKLSPEKLFDAHLEALAGVEDATLRSALAQDIFGKSGVALLPMLSEGTEGLAKMREEARELGVVFSEEDAAAAAEFTDNMQRLRARVTKFQMDVVRKVLPALIRFQKWLGPKMTEAIEAVRPKFEAFVRFLKDPVIPTLKRIADFIMKHIVPAIREFADKLKTTLQPKIEALSAFFVNDVMPVMREFAKWIDEQILPVLKKLGEFINEKVIPAFKAMMTFLGEKLGPKIKEIAGFIAENFGPTLQNIASFVRDDIVPAFESFISVIRRVIKKVKDVINWIKKIPKPDLGFLGDLAGGAGGLLGKLPGFQRGGVVPGPIGAPRLAVVHGGETVISARRRGAAGGGGATFVFAPQIAGSLYTEQQLRELFLRWVREAAQGGSFIGTPLVAG